MRLGSRNMRSRGGVLRCKPHVRLPVVPSPCQHTLKLEYKRSGRSLQVSVWPWAYVFSDHRPDLLLVGYFDTFLSCT
eukprot:8482084-Heterocapsa_arctica.AAC.1